MTNTDSTQTAPGPFEPDIAGVAPVDIQKADPFNTFGANIDTFARAYGDTLTFGAGGVLADQLKTPEEKEQLRREMERNPLASFLGTTAAFLTPGAGELAGLGRAAKALGIAPELGSLVANKVIGAEGSAIAQAALRGTITGAQLGATDAVRQESLSGFDEDSAHNIVTSALLGAPLGLLTETGIASISPAFKALKGVFSKGEGAIGANGVKIDPVEEAIRSQPTDDVAAQNKVQMLDILNEAKNLAEKPEADLTQDDIARGAFIKRYVTKTMNNVEDSEKLFDTGERSLTPDWENANRYQAITNGQKTDIVRETTAKNLADHVNDLFTGIKKFSNDVSNVKTSEINNLIDETVPAIKTQDLAAKYLSGPQSPVDAALQRLSYLTDESSQIENVSARLKSPTTGELPPQHVLDAAVQSETDGLKPGFLKGLQSTLGKAADFASIQKPSDIYSKLDNLVTDLNKFKKTYSKVITNAISPQEQELFNQIYKPLVQGLTNAEDFGPTAANEAVRRTARAAVQDAEIAAKKSLGISKAKVDAATGALDKTSLNKLKVYGAAQGNIKLEDTYKAISDLYDAVGQNYSEILTKTPTQLSEEQQAWFNNLGQSKQRFGELQKDISILNDPKYKEWSKPVRQLTEKMEGGHALGGQSPLYRGIHGIEDLLSGNIMYFKVQMMRFAMESMAKYLAKGKSPSSFEGFVARRMATIEKIKAEGIKTQNKIKSNILSSVATKTISKLDSVPLVMLAAHTGYQEKINRDFEDAKKKITNFSIGSNNSNTNSLITLQLGMQPLNKLSPNLGDKMADKTMQTMNFLAGALPKSNDPMTGNIPVTTSDKAKFLDKMNAIVNPADVVTHMMNGTATPDEIQVFQNYNPNMFQYARSEMTKAIIAHPEMPHAKRALMYSMGVPASMALANKATAQLIQQQQPAQAPAAKPHSSRPTNLRSWKGDAHKTYGTFTTQGMP